MEKMNKYFKFNQIMVFYRYTEPLIKRQQHRLERTLSSPAIKIEEGFNCYSKAENRVEALIKNYNAANEAFNSLNVKDKELVENYIFKNKPAFKVAEERGVSERTFFRRWSKIVDKVLRKYGSNNFIDEIVEADYVRET